MLDTKPYEKEINSWEHLIECYNELSKTRQQWIFRGQKDSEYGLENSLERVIYSFGIDKNDLPQKDDPDYRQRLANYHQRILSGGLEGRSVFTIEASLLREFQRRFHLYGMSVPWEDEILEWLAMMQHYGAPTRLLDWTYSFFVATYFALEEAETECAVWALNSDWMVEGFERILTNYPDALKWWNDDRDLTQRSTFKNLFIRQTPITLVGAVNPYRRNERLVIQQGVFLCPGDISKPFEDNLAALLSASDPRGNFIKYKITGDLSIRKEILLGLHRMNMNNATLFPGLEGFARSLRTFLILPNKWKPKSS